MGLMTAWVNGIPVRVAFEGERTKTPLLIVHGIGGSYRLAQEFLFRYFSREFFCIAPSLPGFGGTPPLSGTHTMVRYADFLAHLLDELKISRAHVIGISMGGTICLALAARHPDRVRKLVLQEAPYRGADFSPETRRIFNIVQRRSHVPCVARLFMRLSRSEFLARVIGGRKRAEEETILEWPEWVDKEDRRETDPRVWVDCVADLTRINLIFSAQDLKIPVFLIGGAASSYAVEATTTRLAAIIPHSSYRLVHGHGHLLPYVAPRIFSELAITFLKKE